MVHSLYMKLVLKWVMRRWWVVSLLFIACIATILSTGKTVHATTIWESCYNVSMSSNYQIGGVQGTFKGSDLAIADKTTLAQCFGDLDKVSQQLAQNPGTVATSTEKTPAGTPVCTLTYAASTMIYQLKCINPATFTTAVTDPLINTLCSQYLDYFKNPTADYDPCVKGGVAAYNACSSVSSGPTGTIKLDTATAASCIKQKTGTSVAASQIKAALDQGIANATSAEQGTKDAQNAEKKLNCTNNGGTWDDATNTCTQASTGAQSTCTIDGVGWLVCPVLTFLGNIADGAMGILSTMFEVPATRLFAQKSGEGAYGAWQTMRNYANVMFVIAFLIIIVSQVTSIGISNYGIKKLLPKLVIVAVLVNISFFICALAVDASNLLGYGLTSLLGGVVAGPSELSANATSQGSVFGGIIAAALTLTAVGLTAYFALSAIAGVVIAVVAIGVAMVILLGIRQALIILLVVIAPLAFVALLLPNTANLFKKWLTLFKSMLLIFPIAGLLYGAGLMAKNILTISSGDSLVQALANALPIIMLILVYRVYMSSMNAVSGVGEFANGLRSGIKKVGSPLKSLAGAQDKLNRQRFLAGNGPVGTRHLGRFATRRRAGYGAKMDANKSEADAIGSRHVRDNMQQVTNRTAVATQQHQNNQLAIKNQGLQNMLVNNRADIEEEGRLKENEKRLEAEKETAKIDASHLEHSLAEVAEQLKKNAQSNAQNISEQHLQTNHPNLVAAEGQLAERSRELAATRKGIQANDANAIVAHNLANRAELATKEAESRRDADWKETVRGDAGLTQQSVNIKAQEMRGIAAEEAVDAAFKDELTAGTLQVANNSGGTVSLRDVRERSQDAQAEITRSEAEIKSQDTSRAATDPGLLNLREGTLIAEKETVRNEARMNMQDEELVAQDQYLTDTVNETRALNNAAGEAKIEQGVKYRDAILNDPALLATAGGNIHPQEGQRRAEASARAEVNKARAELVTNARIQFEAAQDNTEAVSIATTGRNRAGQTASAEEIEAAATYLLEKGSHSQKLEVLGNIAAATNGLGPNQQEAVRSGIADAYVRSSLAGLGGKDFAGTIRNRGPLNAPQTVPDFNAQMRSNLGTVKPESVAGDSKYAGTLLSLYTSGNAAEQAAMAPLLDRIITSIRDNGTLSASADPTTRTTIEAISAAMGAAYTGPAGWAS